MLAEERVKKIVIPLCTDMQLRLVDIKLQGSMSKPIINIFADSAKGITLGQCTELTRLVQDELDMDAGFPRDYRLNVSSPGLDRSLSEDWEFQKNIGQNLSIRYKKDEKNRELQGKLLSWNAENIEIEFDGNSQTISRSLILRAKVKLQW